MQTRYVSTYVAQTKVHAISISKLLVVNELFQYDIFRINYMNMIGNRAQTLYNRLLDKAPCNTEVKIIRFIVARTEWLQGEKWLKVTRVVLVQELGESMVSISKALRRLRGDKMLVLNRKGIIVPDICKLLEWCKEEENRHKHKKE
jgi:CRP-like cAMP-binding protein